MEHKEAIKLINQARTADEMRELGRQGLESVLPLASGTLSCADGARESRKFVREQLNLFADAFTAEACKDPAREQYWRDLANRIEI